MEESVNVVEEFEQMKNKKFRVQKPYLFNNERIIYFRNDNDIDMSTFDRTIQDLIKQAGENYFKVIMNSNKTLYGFSDDTCHIDFIPNDIEYNKNGTYFNKDAFRIYIWLNRKDVVEALSVQRDGIRVGLIYNTEDFENIVKEHLFIEPRLF